MRSVNIASIFFGGFLIVIMLIFVFLSRKNQVQVIDSRAQKSIQTTSLVGPVKIFTNKTSENLVLDLQFAGNGLLLDDVNPLDSKDMALRFLQSKIDVNSESTRLLDKNEISQNEVDFSKYSYNHLRSKNFDSSKRGKSSSEFFAQTIENIPLYHSWLRVDTANQSISGVEGEIVQQNEIIRGQKTLSQLLAISQNLIRENSSLNLQQLQNCGPNQKVIFNTLINKYSSENENLEAFVIEYCVADVPIYRIVVATTGKLLEEESLIFDQATVTVKDCSKGSACPTVQKSGSTGDAQKAFDFFDKSQTTFSGLFHEQIPNSYVTVNAPSSADLPCPNANSNGNNIMKFCQGMIASDVFGHEFGHGIVGRNAGLVYSNQSGALNESYADIFGWTVDDDDWTMGEDTTLGTLRSFSNPSAGKRAQPSQVYDTNYYCGSDQNRYVHINSGVLNHAFYLSVAGGEKNGIKVDPVAKNTVLETYHLALSKYLKSNSNFCDTYKAILKSCDEKTDATNCTKIKTSLEAVQMQFQSASDNKGMYCSGQKTPPATPACVLNAGGGGGSGGGSSPVPSVQGSPTASPVSSPQESREPTDSSPSTPTPSNSSISPSVIIAPSASLAPTSTLAPISPAKKFKVIWN